MEGLAVGLKDDLAWTEREIREAEGRGKSKKNLEYLEYLRELKVNIEAERDSQVGRRPDPGGLCLRKGTGHLLPFASGFSRCARTEETQGDPRHRTLGRR
jgi:hypothetical protein